jgi:hypothetical protein
MNREWMRERLLLFLEFCETWDKDHPSDRTTERQKAAEVAVTKMAPTVAKILDALQPGLGDTLTRAQYIGGMSDNKHAALTGLGILDDFDLVAANLAPDAPSLVADRFHPYVWLAAAAIWDTGEYRVAVEQACVSLSTHIASQAGSHLTERELVNMVFSDAEPTDKQPRLHLPGDKRSKTWKSRQSGLHLLAQGAFAGIRNVSTHSSGDWSEQSALEHLAVLSLVARWTDETTLAVA